MQSLLPFSMSGPFGGGPRAKRKLSSLDKGLSLDDMELGFSSSSKQLSPTISIINSSGSMSKSSTVVMLRWSEICHTIDIKEVFGFFAFELTTVLIAALGCLDWIFFFKFVVEPVDHETRAKWGSVWLLFTMCVLYFRALVRSKCDANMRSLADHAEIFVAVSMVMVFSTNIAFLMHTPSSTPLADLGFMLIPAQAIDSKWRPLSDILTASMPIFFLLQAHAMQRENRCRVMISFFRVATVNYALRMCTVALTSLPGPAPHCRPDSPQYLPPQNWIDVITRIGPMYGNYNSCGDLIFSGHMAYTTTAVLLYLRVLDRHFPRFSTTRWLVGAVYLCVLAGLCVAGRKHYTVDVVLGFMIAALVFFHFEHSWTPLWMTASSHQHHGHLIRHHHNSGSSKRSRDNKRFASIEILEDDDHDEQAMDEYDDDGEESNHLLKPSSSSLMSSSSSSKSSSPGAGGANSHERGEFIC